MCYYPANHCQYYIACQFRTARVCHCPLSWQIRKENNHMYSKSVSEVYLNEVALCVNEADAWLYIV